MLLGESYVGQHIGRSCIHDDSELGHLGAVLISDGTPLGASGFGGFLGEGGGDEGRDNTSVALAGTGQNIAHEVDRRVSLGSGASLACVLRAVVVSFLLGV